MAGELKQKAKKRSLGTAGSRLIIGEAASGSGTHVKETTIELKPGVKRGGTIGQTIGGRKRQGRKTGGITTGMGGRH